MSLIDQQKDLESFSDQALLQEASQPMRGYPPYLVMAEIQRRQEDRQRVQRQAQAQEPKQPPVATQQIQAFINQMQAPVAQPEAITADMGQMAGMGMAEPQMAPEQMQMAPEEAMMDQSGIMAGAPVQGMAGGGVVRKFDGKAAPGFFSLQHQLPGLYTESGELKPWVASARNLLAPRSSEAGLVRRIRELEAAGQDASALRAELNKMKGRVSAPALGAGPTPTASSAPGITSLRADPEMQRQFTASMNEIKGRDLMNVPQIQGVPVERQKSAPRPRPPAAPGASAPMAQAAPVAPAAAAAPADTYWADMMKKFEGYQPSEKEFERDRRAALLASLGEAVGGATRRGDIAKGLAAIAREQVGSKREFQKQMREYEMGLMGLRGQQRAETREEERIRLAREEAKAIRDEEIALRKEDLRIKRETAEEAVRSSREETALKRQELAEARRLGAASAEINRLNFELKKAEIAKTNAEAILRLVQAKGAASAVPGLGGANPLTSDSEVFP